jgi:hypothetical protein
MVALYALYLAFPFDWTRGTPLRWGLQDLAGDVVTLAVCLACAHGARGYWIVWVSAFSLLNVVTDLLYIEFRTVTAFAWLSADYIWGYGQCVGLLWGAFTEGRARKSSSA